MPDRNTQEMAEMCAIDAMSDHPERLCAGKWQVVARHFPAISQAKVVLVVRTRRRMTVPSAIMPTNIMPHVAGSGTGDTSIVPP